MDLVEGKGDAILPVEFLEESRGGLSLYLIDGPVFAPAHLNANQFMAKEQVASKYGGVLPAVVVIGVGEGDIDEHFA